MSGTLWEHAGPREAALPCRRDKQKSGNYWNLMKNTLRRLFFAGLLALFFASGQALRAADQPTAKTQNAAEQVKAKRNWYPFGGIVSGIDIQAGTVSLVRKVGARILRIDPNSILEINGRPAALASVKIGSYAHGKLHKNSAGNEVITSAKFEKEAPNKTRPAANR